MPRLLLVEDDPAIARAAAYALDREGWQVTHSLLLADARAQWAAGGIDLIVLDIGLPDGSGLDWLRELRQRPDGGAPVLMLSARGEEIDRVLGLELGADDYLAKPFGLRELAARCKAMLRRLPARPPAQAQGLEHDRAGQRVRLHGRPLALTRREYQLLACLLDGHGRILSREALLAAAWGESSDSFDRTVDTHVKTLRAKLREADPALAECIVTHRGMGYSLER